MKTILITENQLKSLIENILIEQQDNNRTLELLKKKALMDEWFYENIVNKVKPITYPEFPDKIYYLNKNTGQLYMEYNQKNGNFWVDYYKIWSYFYFNYSYNDIEIKQLIKDLVGEHYNLWGITPYIYRSNNVILVGEH